MNAQDVMALTISTTIFRSGPASKFKALGRTPLALVPARGANRPLCWAAFTAEKHMNWLNERINEHFKGARDHAYTLGMRRGLLMAELTDDEIMKTETLVAVLRDLDARLRECMALGLSAAEAYDSFYQETTAEALAVGAAYAELTRRAEGTSGAAKRSES